MSWAFLRMKLRPSSTRQTMLSARPTAPNAPDAPHSDVASAIISAVNAVPRCDWADSSAFVTASTVSSGAPACSR